jgi:hypothetical protein
MTDKSIEEIDEMRMERGIKQSNLSVCSGRAASSFSNALGKGYISDRFKEDLLKVLDYYDERGIIPLPEEIDTEKT